jgi:hypothetical protein
VTVDDADDGTDADTVRITVSPGDTDRLTIRAGDGGTVSVPPNSEVELPIVVDRAPDGLARIDGLNVSIGDTAVATVETDRPLDHGAGGFDAGQIDVTAVGPGFVNVSARASRNATAPGPGSDVPVGTVVLATGAGGTTTVDLAVGAGYTESVLSNSSTARATSRVRFRTVDASLRVTPFPERATPPTDARAGLPGLEDFDGNGRFDFRDVVAVLFALDDLAVDEESRLDAVDYDDDGRFSFIDVVELLFRLQDA